MTAIQQLLDYIEQLKRLDAGTLEVWLTEHALFTLVLIVSLTIWALMTIKDITKRSKR
jgi:hypothetical protein